MSRTYSRNLDYAHYKKNKKRRSDRIQKEKIRGLKIEIKKEEDNVRQEFSNYPAE